MRRAVVAGILTASLMACGCGIRSSGVITGVSSPEAQVLTAVPSAQAGAPGVRPIYLVFRGSVVPVPRTGPGDHEAVLLLFTGPTPAERSAGLSTAIPTSTTLAGLILTPQGYVISITGSAEPLSGIAEQQIACTLSARSDPPGTQVLLNEPGAEPHPVICGI